MQLKVRLFSGTIKEVSGISEKWSASELGLRLNQLARLIQLKGKPKFTIWRVDDGTGIDSVMISVVVVDETTKEKAAVITDPFPISIVNTVEPIVQKPQNRNITLQGSMNTPGAIEDLVRGNIDLGPWAN